MSFRLIIIGISGPASAWASRSRARPGCCRFSAPGTSRNRDRYQTAPFSTRTVPKKP